MEQKKSPRANLELQRYKMFLMAIILVASFFYSALQWNSLTDEQSNDDDLIEDVDFNKLKHKDDMVAAITETDNPNDDSNIHSNHVVTEKQVAPSESKLLVGDGQGEIKEATVEEVVPQTLQQDEQEPEGFKAIEELPEFPGGSTAFMKWITKNLSYPYAAQQNKIEGKVVVSFIVDKQGKVTNLKLDKSDNPQLGNAVLAVMRKMPQWKPGKTDGHPCNAMIAVPIDFSL